jgi:hypothetical protein
MVRLYASTRPVTVLNRVFCLFLSCASVKFDEGGEVIEEAGVEGPGFAKKAL